MTGGTCAASLRTAATSMMATRPRDNKAPSKAHWLPVVTHNEHEVDISLNFVVQIDSSSRPVLIVYRCFVFFK